MAVNDHVEILSLSGHLTGQIVKQSGTIYSVLVSHVGVLDIEQQWLRKL